MTRLNGRWAEENAYALSAIASRYPRVDLNWGADLDFVQRCLTHRPVRAVLDVGCGPGFHISALPEFLPDACFVGLDSSSAMLEEARKRIDSLGLGGVVKLTEADAYHYALEAHESFDAVICMNNTLGSIFEEETLVGAGAAVRRRIVVALTRLLSAGGRLVVSVYLRDAGYPPCFENGLSLDLATSDVERGELVFSADTSELRCRFVTHWFTEREIIGLAKESGAVLESVEKRYVRLLLCLRSP